MSYDLFLHNWADRVEITTAWETDVTYSTETGAEQRLGLLANKPKRSIKVSWLGWDRILGLRLLTFLQQSSDQGQRIPLYPDQSVTTATSSGTSIYCPTANRRFAMGSLVVIHERDSEGRASNHQFGTVASFDSTSITLESALTGSYSAGALVFPVIECLKLLDARGKAHTDGVFEVGAEFEEVLGPNSLDPSAAETADQILQIGPDWGEDVEIGMVRLGTRTQFGRAEQVDTQATAPVLTFKFTATQLTRADMYEVLQVFDGCRGQLQPLWLMNPLVVFEPVVVASGYLDVVVPSEANITDVSAYVRYLGLRHTDGSLEILTVTGITLQSGPVWRIAVAETITASLSEIREATTAHWVRFSSDELVEEWVTDDAGQIELAFQEVLDEAEYSHGATFTACGVA